MKRMHKSLLVNVLFLLFLSQIVSQTSIELEPFANGLSIPVGIEHAGDHRLFVVEKPGRIQILDSLGQINGQPFLSITSRVNSQSSEQGLLGLAFHPDYQENGYFYLNYTRNDNSTVVSRFSRDSLNADLADPSSEKIILVVGQPFRNHNAGQLAFGPDGYLYIGMGDGGAAGDPQDNSQDPQTLLGKMLRIDVDNGDPYAIPPDNPFADDDFTLDEIWALGLRNPWRYSFDEATGDLYIADVGQNAWEEINVQPAESAGGENYGWRCYEGPAAFDLDNCPDASLFTFPAHSYAHEGFNCTGSITGGYVYHGEANPALQGKYIYVDYCTGKFSSWNPADSTSEFLLESTEQVYTTFGLDANGEIYVASGQGTIYSITDNTTSTSQPRADDSQSIVLYPNPAQTEVRFKFGKNSAGTNVTAAYDVMVTNASGAVVLTMSDVYANQSIDIRDLVPGVYHFKLHSEDVKPGLHARLVISE